MQCPFCMEENFDAIGLKHHLVHGYCKGFEATMSVIFEANLSLEDEGEPLIKNGKYYEVVDRGSTG